MKGPKHHRFKRHNATFGHKITPVFSIIPAFIAGRDKTGCSAIITNAPPAFGTRLSPFLAFESYFILTFKLTLKSHLMHLFAIPSF
jgi:hypothetical protein